MQSDEKTDKGIFLGSNTPSKGYTVYSLKNKKVDHQQRCEVQ